MAFVVNGVSLPDIPADVLEKYPYASILAGKDAADILDSYFLMVSGTAHYHIDKSLVDADENIIAFFAPGALYMPCMSDGEWSEWTLMREVPESDVIYGIVEVPNTDGRYNILVWANHDIYEVTSCNTETLEFTTGENIFFFDSTVAFEEEYSAPSTWFVGMANGIRKLTRERKRYTTDEMLEALDTVEWWGKPIIDEGKKLTDGYEILEYGHNITSDTSKDIDLYPFTVNGGVETVSFPNTKAIGRFAFSGCKFLNTVDIPQVVSVGYCAFNGCELLEKLDLPSAKSIEGFAFTLCKKLSTLILMATDSMCELVTVPMTLDNVSMPVSTICDNDTPIANGTGYIYVPSALVDTYKTDANWSAYAAQFRAIEDYPDICGTT